MLKTPAPFPYVGSFALFEEPDKTHLVRIVHSYHAGGEWRVTAEFPMVDGATGNRTLNGADLIDATPLDRPARRRLAELDLALHGRRISSPRLKALKAERDRLARRAQYAPLLERKLKDAAKPWAKRPFQLADVA